MKKPILTKITVVKSHLAFIVKLNNVNRREIKNVLKSWRTYKYNNQMRNYF